MSSLDAHALSWLRTHHATISVDALDESGIDLDRRKRLVEAGMLRRIVDGAYAFTGVTVDELARCAALCTSRPQLVVGGPTAGRLWELRRAPRDGLVHVVAPPRSHPCQEPWVRAYRTDQLGDDEIVERPDGIRLTSPPRTVVDLTRYVDEVSLASVIEHALSRRLCTLGTLHRTAMRLATRGRPWVKRFVAVLEQRDPGPAAQSEVELRVFEALASRGIAGLRRQVRVVLPGYGRAYFDMAVTDIRWAVEVDLHPEHNTLQGVARDKGRDTSADLVGWSVRRVSELELAGPTFETTMDALAMGHRRRVAEAEALRAVGRW